MRLIEFTRKGTRPAETRQDLPRLTVDDFNLRVVLIDQVNEFLRGIVGEVERDSRTAALSDFPVFGRRHGRPRDVDVFPEVAHLVVDLDPSFLAVADIDLPIIRD